ncbi:hypothetical protein OH492_13990 [Vibrio chagasii]|nr:hypothetical protein [Vibrio chagasii]
MTGSSLLRIARGGRSVLLEASRSGRCSACWYPTMARGAYKGLSLSTSKLGRSAFMKY